MGPYFKPEVSQQGPPCTSGTYACRWAKNDWTVPCQREPGVPTGLPCYPQYEVRPRGVMWWTCCCSSYTDLGLNPWGDLPLLKNRQSSSTLETAWCAVLCPTLLHRSWGMREMPVGLLYRGWCLGLWDACSPAPVTEALLPLLGHPSPRAPAWDETDS